MELAPEDRKRYAKAEKRVRSERRGLWRDKDPRPVWEYQKLVSEDSQFPQGLLYEHGILSHF